MKYTKFICLVVILFISSCNPYDEIEVEEKWDYTFEHSIECETPACLMEWVADEDNVEYAYDSDMYPGCKDYWQLPHTTYITGFGDCEDFSLLLLHLLYEQVPEKEMYLARVAVGPTQTHIVIWYDGDYYEPQSNIKLFKPDVVWMCTYGEAIWMTYYYHDSVGEFG